MITHIWSVLCRESVIDSESNNMSLFNVFEQLQIRISAPAPQNQSINVPLQYELVSMLHKDNKRLAEKVEIEVSIINPDGEVVLTQPKEITFPAGLTRMRSRMRISGLKIDTEGEYIFRVRLKHENKKDYISEAEIPLEVTLQRATA